MFDTIIVAAIILIAVLSVGRRLFRQFSSRNSAHRCSGCGQSNSCSAAQNNSSHSNGCESR